MRFRAFRLTSGSSSPPYRGSHPFVVVFQLEMVFRVDPYRSSAMNAGKSQCDSSLETCFASILVAFSCGFRRYLSFVCVRALFLHSNFESLSHFQRDTGSLLGSLSRSSSFSMSLRWLILVASRSNSGTLFS